MLCQKMFILVNENPEFLVKNIHLEIIFDENSQHFKVIKPKLKNFQRKKNRFFLVRCLLDNYPIKNLCFIDNA
jgi:hypothetical protein